MAMFQDVEQLQLLLEEKYKNYGIESVRNHYAQAQTDRTSGDTTIGTTLTALQYKLVKGSVTSFLETLLAPKRGAKPAYYGLLQHITQQTPLEDLAQAATIVIINALINHTITASGATVWLSNVANDCYKDLELEINTMQAYNQLDNRSKHIANEGVAQRGRKDYRMKYLRSFCQKRGIETHVCCWDKENARQLLAVLIYVVVSSSDWFTMTENAKGTTIDATETLLAAWVKNVNNQVLLGHRFCPMIIPPRPWSSMEDGGYIGILKDHTNLLRIHSFKSLYTKTYCKRIEQTELTVPLKALNAIQNTPWKVNTKVLETLKEIVKLGGARAGIPKMTPEDRPRLASTKPTSIELKVYKKRVGAWVRNDKKRASLILRLMSTVSMADDFAQYSKIYFPYNMDFRGRIYPIPAFNPQGDDATKGLLLFADVEGIKNVDELDWFYITGANLAGVDKVSYSDRILWVKENWQAILASASDPLEYDFWQHQDEPFQFLAFCLECKSLVDYQAANGTCIGWQTGIPIAMDGTCSGLQHFSAILRDEIGGQAVNLLAADKPQDIYQVVANKVNEMLKVDALQGTEDEEVKGQFEDTYIKIGSKTLAQGWLAYGVTRKVTKRNVMTLAYGSKQYGFKKQLLEDIIKPDVDSKDELSVFAIGKAQFAAYLAKLTWDAVSSTVIKAVEGMKWLQEVSKQVVTSSNVVMWTTPAGLPVQQHYMDYDITTIQLRVLNKRIRLYNAHCNGNIDRHKQTSGIAPNFIHSMDASHLQLTVSNCVDQGIKHFAVVHDSYACPLNQADILYKSVRESFVKMYSEHDVLEEFASYLQHLTDTKLPPPPPKGTLDLNKVLESPYFVC